MAAGPEATAEHPTLREHREIADEIDRFLVGEARRVDRIRRHGLLRDQRAARPKLQKRTGYPNEKKTRNHELYAARLQGLTYPELGRRFGVTPPRAREIYLREWSRRLASAAAKV